MIEMSRLPTHGCRSRVSTFTFFDCNRLSNFQGTNWHRNTMQKFSFINIEVWILRGDIEVFWGSKTRFYRNLKSTPLRKLSLVSIDSAISVSFLFMIQ